jgi:hypothetical protein
MMAGSRSTGPPPAADIDKPLPADIQALLDEAIRLYTLGRTL